jgi:mannose-6-phosphate isomerase-like protein (cupin superfamily)
MVSNLQKLVMVKPRAKTCYERWMEREGVPIVERFGVSDVQGLSLGRWNRLGCDGAYLQFRGLDGVTGAYLGKISGGTMTEPENQLYEKVIYIIEGEGVAEFQQRGRVPQSISWKTGSLFSAPLNATHRLINHSKKPAFFLAVTTAPMILDHFHNEQFVFNSEFAFSDRYDGEDDYFNVREQRYLVANNPQWVCETNFIPDACKAALDAQRQKRADVKITQLEIAKNTLVGQVAEWPVGRYHKAQDHGGGGVVVILRSQGYSLMWPKEWGT